MWRLIDISHIASNRPGARKARRKIRPTRPSRATEVAYRRDLLQVVDSVDKIARAELLPLLETPAMDRAARSGTVLDYMFPRLMERIRQLARSFGGIQGQAERMAHQAARKAAGDVDKRLTDSIRRSVGIDITGALPSGGSITNAMQNAVKANVDLIKTIPSQHFERIGEKVEKAFTNGARSTELAKLIQDQTGVTKSRAKLIARDQIGKMNSDFSRVRQQSLGITQYIWRTAQDERVRDEHADLDGQTFSWDDPPSEGHPGFAIQCRCVAEPLFNLQ